MQQHVPPPATVRTDEALWTFFVRSDTPAALCTTSGRILSANKAFGVRVGAQTEAALNGREVTDLLACEPPIAPFDADAEGLAVTFPGGRAGLANVVHTGEVVILTLDAGLEGARLAQARRAIEQQQRVFEIGRMLSLLMHEENLVGVVAQGLRELFQGRDFGIRVTDPNTMELTSLYAEGDLIHAERERLCLKRSAVPRTRLPPRVLQSDRISVREKHHLIFEGAEAGISVPLVAGNQIFGMLNVEGTRASFHDIEADERLLIALANQLSVALRNVKLLTESRYLRGYLEKLIDNANALVLVVDRKSRLTVFNRACQELSGYGRDEVIGTDLANLFPPEERARLGRLLTQTSKGKGAENVEASILASDGRKIRVAFNTATILGSEGEVDGVIIIGNDLTRLWELERQVIQAEKLASLGQLAAAVVHELNNPLTSITVYAEYLRDRLESMGAEREMQKAGRILEGADRILKFTRNLVAYARPSEDRPVRVCVREVAEESVQLCEHVIHDRRVAVHVDWDETPAHVAGNRGKLQQVFVNLITNACQAMEPEGRIAIRGTLDAGWLEVRVSDTGQGIPAGAAERIFEPFFSTKPPGEGTGLGLSIVHGIVKNHGGTIEVESTPDEGTTFVVRLPLDADDLQ